MKTRSLVFGVIGLAGMLMAIGSAQASSLTVNQIIYQSGTGVNSGLYSGTVNVTGFGTDQLTILLQNTSADGAVTASSGSTAQMLLTGLGFELSGGQTISGGSVSVASGSTALNFGSGQSTTDIGNQWGYHSGTANDGFSMSGVLAVNTEVSTIHSAGTTRFEGAPPASIDGPAYGAVSASETQFGSSLAGVDDTIQFVLNFSGAVNANDISDVVLAFGSPDTVPGNGVPDGGSTALLLGAALSVFGLIHRKRS